ncbi:MAG: LON peptidase substrate-binding domain-containing protein [Deinococcus sp.]|nr:LON peptidase substrate-binding domain-containing protein [Deinococcus sp.]
MGKVKLPDVIPIFPLPNVVLFPGVSLPLHIFEPRYKAMVADALAEAQIIGMVLLKPGYEADYYGRPPAYDLGCAGRITVVEQLPDGRYNIVLNGIQRFRILEEYNQRLYRTVQVEWLCEESQGWGGRPLSASRGKLLELIADLTEPSGGHLSQLDDATLVNHLCHLLPLSSEEKQGLLEANGLAARCDWLTQLLEFHQMERQLATPGCTEDLESKIRH